MHASGGTIRSASVWFILLLAFGLRLAGAVYWHQLAENEGRLFRLGDSEGYWVLANHIAQGEAYEYGSENARIFRAPLFPIVLSPFAALGGNTPSAVFYARVFGAILGTFAVGELMWLAARLGGPSAARWAGLIAAISPAAIGMSVMVLSEMLLVPLMLGHLLLWQQAWSASSRRNVVLCSCLAGVVAGLAILARPSWLLFAPFLLGLGLLFGPQRGRHFKIGVLTLMAMSVVMVPWWLRNAQVTGKFIPTTLQVGPSLYDGLHPAATGASDEGMDFMQAIVAEQMAEDAGAEEPLVSTLEYRINRRAQQQAMAFARNQPLEVVRLAGTKFMRTWSLWPDGGELGSTAMRLAITLATFSVLLLAFYGTWRLWVERGRDSLSSDRDSWGNPLKNPLSRVHGGWWLAVCWVPCLYFTLLHMVFVGSIRYREPAVFVLAAVAGCALADLTRRVRDRLHDRSLSRVRTNRSVPGQHVSASEPS